MSSNNTSKQLSVIAIKQKIQFYASHPAFSEAEKHKYFEKHYSLLVRAYKKENRFKKATIYAQKALESALIGYPHQPLRTAICQSNLATCFAIREQYATAIPLLEQALAVYRDLKNEKVVLEIEDDLKYLHNKLKMQKTLNSFALPPAPSKTVQYRAPSFYPDEAMQTISRNTAFSTLKKLLPQNSSDAQSPIKDKHTVTFSVPSKQSSVVTIEKKSNHANNTTLVLQRRLGVNPSLHSFGAGPIVTFTAPSLKPTVTFTSSLPTTRKPDAFKQNADATSSSRRHAVTGFPFPSLANQDQNTSANQPELTQPQNSLKTH